MSDCTNSTVHCRKLSNLYTRASETGRKAFIASFAAYGNIFDHIAYNVFILQYHKCREQMQNAY
jgi:hypothetical protein